jgi:hypothetical protein
MLRAEVHNAEGWREAMGLMRRVGDRWIGITSVPAA